MATKQRKNAKEKAIKAEIKRQKEMGIIKEREYKKFDVKDNYLYYNLVVSLMGKAIYKLRKATREADATEEYGYNSEKYETLAVDGFAVDRVMENKELEDKIYRAIEIECIKQAKEWDLADMEE